MRLDVALTNTHDLQVQEELPLSLLFRSSSTVLPLSKGAALHNLPGAEGWENPFWILGWGCEKIGIFSRVIFPRQLISKSLISLHL